MPLCTHLRPAEEPLPSIVTEALDAMLLSLLSLNVSRRLQIGVHNRLEERKWDQCERSGPGHELRLTHQAQCSTSKSPSVITHAWPAVSETHPQSNNRQRREEEDDHRQVYPPVLFVGGEHLHVQNRNQEA